MPPKRKAAKQANRISNLVELSDDELEDQPTKRRATKKNATPEEEPKLTRQSRAKGSKAPAATKKGKKGGRGKKQQSVVSEDEDEEDENTEEFHDSIQVASSDPIEAEPQPEENKGKRTTSKKGAPATKEEKKPAPKGRGRRKAAEPESEDEEMEDAVEVVVEKEIAETQQEEEEEEEQEEEPQLPMAPPPKPKKAGRSKKEVVKPTAEIQETQYTPGQFREDSPKAENKKKASSKEEVSDTRDINQLRKENEELKEHIAKLIAVEETEPERLLKEFRLTAVEAEDKAQEAIDSLRATIKEQDTLAAQLRLMKREVNSRNIRIEELQEELSSMETKLELQRSECNALKAKLAARASVPPPSAISNIKGAKPGTISATAVHDAWLAEAKEDFYADLIGLAVLGVKKEKNEDSDKVQRIFECLATGKAGTLHFKLYLPDDATDTTADIGYVPLINAQRDKALLETMPDYLSEEITFTRDALPKFYSKIENVLNPKK